MPKKTIKQESSKSITHIFFRKNIASEEVTIADTDIKFRLEALSDLALTYCRRNASLEDGSVDEITLQHLFIKFGLVGVENLKDEDGNEIQLETEEIKILNTSVKCVKDSFIYNLARNLKIHLATIIAEISELTIPEEKKLEFFRKSC